jgi:hypothetical protein
LHAAVSDGRELDVDAFVPGVEVGEFLRLKQGFEGFGDRSGLQIAELVKDQLQMDRRGASLPGE